MKKSFLPPNGYIMYLFQRNYTKVEQHCQKDDIMCNEQIPFCTRFFSSCGDAILQSKSIFVLTPVL